MLFRVIRTKALWELFPTEVRFLFGLEQSAYDEVVRLLLADNGEYAQSLPSHHYRDVYQCQIAGSVLFAMRPNRQLYGLLLEGSLKIGDPSSCRDAVVAMLQVKASGEVALDFLGIIEKYRHRAHADELVSRVFAMFYWLGTGPGGLTINRAWPGYSIYSLYAQWFNQGLMWPDESDPETGYPSTPPTAPEQAKYIAERILETMLELFEANTVGQTAQTISALLPSPDRQDLALYRERLLQTIQRAHESPDEYMRQRARLLDVGHIE
jgi:hypothetical protein